MPTFLSVLGVDHEETLDAAMRAQTVGEEDKEQCWVEREVCREVYAPVPVTPEDTGNARRAPVTPEVPVTPPVPVTPEDTGNALLATLLTRNRTWRQAT